MKIALIVGILTLCLPVMATEHTSRPAVQIVVVDDSLQQFSVLWQKEIGRRFPIAVAILCHGGSIQEGEWVVKAPYGEHPVMKAADLVKHYQVLYPNRQIVLLACNPSHLKLGIPGVYYSNSSVWCVPDRDIINNQTAQYLKMDGTEIEKRDNRSDIDPDTVGDIFEFDKE